MIKDFLLRKLDTYISHLGYSKAVSSPHVVFAGETYPGAEYNIYANYSYNEFYRLAITNYAVYRNIMLIAKTVAGGLIEVQKQVQSVGDAEGEYLLGDEKWKPVADHPFEKLIEYKPNPYMSQSFIWMYQVFWLLLSGEAYWMNVPLNTGELAQIYPLPADRVKPIPHPTSFIDYFSYTPINGTYPSAIPTNQICFHRFPNPFEYHRGLSPISAYLMGLQLNTEAQKTDLDDYRNRLNLQQLISVRSQMNDRDFYKAQADLQEAVNAGKRWKMIRAGDMEVKQTSQERGDFSKEVYQITEEQANSIYGVPDGIWDKEANRASAQEQKAVLIENTVWPLMCMLAEDITIQIVEPYYGEGIRAVFQDIRKRNIELELKETESKRKTQTYNEARAEMDLDPYPDPIVGNAPFEAVAEVYKALIGQKIFQENAQVIPQQNNLQGGNKPISKLPSGDKGDNDKEQDKEEEQTKEGKESEEDKDTEKTIGILLQSTNGKH